MKSFSLIFGLFLFSLPSVGWSLSETQIAAALDSGSVIAWEASTDDWTVVGGALAHDGVDALKTPVLENGQSSSLNGILVGPGVLRGWMKASSELHHDVLQVELNHSIAAAVSGEQTKEFEIVVPSGSHRVTLKWQRDQTVSAGQNAGWLDGFSFTRTALSMAEAVDLAGTPEADLLTFSQPNGTGWQGLPNLRSRMGGDCLQAFDGQILRLIAAQPMVLSFWVNDSRMTVTGGLLLGTM